MNNSTNKKIGIYCLTIGIEDQRGRLPLILSNLKQLKNTKYDNYHFYILADNIDDNFGNLAKEILSNNLTIINNFPKNSQNYLTKINFSLQQNHEFSVKMDDDTFMTSESWNEFLINTENISDQDLFFTGNITNGIPTCELYIDNYLKNHSNTLKKLFYETNFGYIGGVDYSPLNYSKSKMKETWDENIFYDDVKNFYHYYKGIHPIRVNFNAAVLLNDLILKNVKESLSFNPKLQIIKDAGNCKYPYFCNNIFAIKTNEWKKLLERKDLYVDSFDEVVLNKYRNEKNLNMVVHTGIPIVHTIYNWITEPNYEKHFIQNLIQQFN